MGKIKIIEGSNELAAASHNHLVRNHLIDPNANIDKVIQYAERRYLMTLLVSGATAGRYTAPGYTGKDTAKTRIKAVPDRELTANMSWQYRIMGRIQKATEILALVGIPTAGTVTTGGFFSLRAKDDSLYPGMNVVFPNGKIARVQSRPTGGPNNYVYQFQCKPGDTFSWITWFQGQAGAKTVFGAYSTYGERSLRGYGRVFYPDTYINHMTTQRKSISISGDANSERVVWYEYNGVKGWSYEAEIQTRMQFNLEDDFQKMWGVSNMKDANGNLLSSPTSFDQETGEPIYEGDGWLEQVRGANDFETSGSNGEATYDDFSDMITTIKKKGDSPHKIYYVMTGADGVERAAEIIGNRAIQLGMQFTMNQTMEAGGASMPIGFNFFTLNVAGQQLIFVENPQMDDVQKFPARLSNGKLRMSSTYYFMDMSPDNVGKPNMEIRARGREGINRNYVMLYKNGMTGEGQAQEAIDAKEFHILKQNMFVVYNTKTCGVLQASANA